MPVQLIKQIKMKKLSLLLLAAVFSLSIYSCRETTEERTEDSIEEVGNDLEESTEEVGNDLEGAAEDAELEVEEEVQGTDDIDVENDVQ